jgi:hypothetical protein
VLLPKEDGIFPVCLQMTCKIRDLIVNNSTLIQMTLVTHNVYLDHFYSLKSIDCIFK